MIHFQSQSLLEPTPLVRAGNPAERQAQADRVMTRELKQAPVTVERRKGGTPNSRRRRRSDRAS
jgi:hypothetical protein